MGSLLDTPIPPRTAAQRREMEENMPLEFRQARRRKRPSGTILTSGLNVEYPPTPPIRLLASDDEEQPPPPPPPPPDEPEKPEPKPEPPKEPEEPDEPDEPDEPEKDCEHIRDELTGAVNDQEKNSNEMIEIKKKILFLKEQIKRLRNVQDVDSPPAAEKEDDPHNPKKRRPKMPKDFWTFFFSVIEATDSKSGLSRMERIVKASEEIANLEAELKILEHKDNEIRRSVAALSQLLRDCERGSNGSAPDR